MSTYGERLQQAMQLAGLTGRDARSRMAVACGMTVQAIGQVLTGPSKNFTAVNHVKAARYLRVDALWLATGEGEPRPPGSSKEAQAFAAEYDKLTLQEQRLWRSLMEAAKASAQPVEAPVPTMI